MEKYIINTTYYPHDNRGGFSDSIHSGYVNSIEIETDNIARHKIGMTFGDNIFNQDTSYGNFDILVNIPKLNEELNKDVNTWIKYKIGNEFLVDERYEIDLNDYVESLTGETNTYNLTEDIKYPKNITPIENPLSFGEENIFFGNVGGTIKADVYTTDIYINLPMGEFNSTTNPTWDNESSVYITEVGIYDSNDNLVAIGKLNNPIEKNSNISRTILFSIDF